MNILFRRMDETASPQFDESMILYVTLNKHFFKYFFLCWWQINKQFFKTKIYIKIFKRDENNNRKTKCDWSKKN